MAHAQSPGTASAGDPAASAAGRREHARRARRVTIGLLAVWFVVSFGVPFFARDLSFRILGWPFSYWMAAQGSLLVYVSIATGYALYMNRLDARYGVDAEG